MSDRIIQGGKSRAIRPMLAHTEPVAPSGVDVGEFGVWVSPKLDGIRCLQMGSVSKSRKLKDLPNWHVQRLLAHPLLDGMDGEVVVGSPTAPDCINATTSGVMSMTGEPAFALYVFDRWDDPETGFVQRQQVVRRRVVTAKRLGLPVMLVPQVLCLTQGAVEAAVGTNYDAGYEGSIVRSYDAKYKYNRSTRNEGVLLKVKESMDSEILVTQFIEQRSNQNEATVDALGLTKRSTHQSNKVAAGTLGKLIGVDVVTGATVTIGTGKMTAADKQHVWDNREMFMGSLAKYRYAAHGIKDLPRHPRFITWRNPIDT